MKTPFGERWSSLDEPGDRVGSLFDLGGRIPGPRRVDDAVRQVILEQADRHRLQRALGGRDLSQDIDAVRVLVDHPLQAADLPLDPAQSPEQGGLVTGVPMRTVLLRNRLVGHANQDTPSPYASRQPSTSS